MGNPDAVDGTLVGRLTLAAGAFRAEDSARAGRPMRRGSRLACLAPEPVLAGLVQGWCSSLLAAANLLASCATPMIYCLYNMLFLSLIHRLRREDKGVVPVDRPRHYFGERHLPGHHQQQQAARQRAPAAADRGHAHQWW